MDEVFFKICFAQICCATVASCIAIYVLLIVRSEFFICAGDRFTKINLHDFQFDGFYFPSFVILINFLFQIASFCALGTVTEIAVSSKRITILSSQLFFWNISVFQCEDLYDAICACNWYLLEPKQKQMYSILIQNSQEPRILSIGGFKELNMITCVSVSINRGDCPMKSIPILKKFQFSDIQNDLFIRNFCLRIFGSLMCHRMDNNIFVWCFFWYRIFRCTFWSI